MAKVKSNTKICDDVCSKLKVNFPLTKFSYKESASSVDFTAKHITAEKFEQSCNLSILTEESAFPLLYPMIKWLNNIYNKNTK